MSLMKCPRCDGCGSFWNYQEGTATAGYNCTCPSCGGSGYISDYIQAPPAPALSVKVWIKCPHCDKQIEAQLFQGTYTAIKVDEELIEQKGD